VPRVGGHPGAGHQSVVDSAERPAQPPGAPHRGGACGSAGDGGRQLKLRCEVFLGRSFEQNPQFQQEPEDADMMVDDVPLAQLLDEFEQQCAVSNEIVAAHSLDDVGKHPDFGAAAATLRWMLLHMVEETARHVGHLDTIRELLDGEKGYY
jgi:hypothetical protein